MASREDVIRKRSSKSVRPGFYTSSPDPSGRIPGDLSGLGDVSNDSKVKSAAERQPKTRQTTKKAGRKPRSTAPPVDRSGSDYGIPFVSSGGSGSYGASAASETVVSGSGRVGMVFDLYSIVLGGQHG